MRQLYSVIFYLLLPLVILRLLWRGFKAPAYVQRWGERFGFIAPLREVPRIWLHAVSVGETLAAVPLVKQLLKAYPEYQLLITTTTPTGSERVQALFGDNTRIEHYYAPYDLPDCLYRFLNRVRPNIFIVMETELWPNTIAACHKRGIPTVVANARLSAKSARGYGKFSALAKPMLKAIDCVAVQNTTDAQRFLSLGLPESQLSVTGSIKFDLDLSDELCARAQTLKQQWSDNGRRLIWLVASTHPGEDEQILNAFNVVQQQYSEVLLVLVPRHPERFDSVFELCQNRGFNTERRSEVTSPKASCNVFLGDTMGELLLFFGASDLAFVGGSLVPVGGHNLIEPAAWSLPVLSGPELHNFAEVEQLLTDADALMIARSSDELSAQVLALLRDAPRRLEMGRAAKQVAEANRGALARLLNLIANQLKH